VKKEIGFIDYIVRDVKILIRDPFLCICFVLNFILTIFLVLNCCYRLVASLRGTFVKFSTYPQECPEWISDSPGSCAKFDLQADKCIGTLGIDPLPLVFNSDDKTVGKAIAECVDSLPHTFNRY